jgi:Zn-dependent protease with chaperone function
MPLLNSALRRRILPALLAFLFVIASAPSTIAKSTRRSQSSDEQEYLRKLSEADRFYAEGDVQMSQRIRTSVKATFTAGSAASSAPPIVDPESEKLAPAAQVYWRNAKEGTEQKLNIKVLTSLQYLADGYPDFLPGHLKLAEICEAEPKECKDIAKSQQPSSAIDVLERASNLYPKNVTLLDAKLALLERMAERNETKNAFFVKLLDASIAARQYALAYPDAPDADKYRKLADRYMSSYQSKLKQSVGIYATLGAAFGSSASGKQLLSLARGENAYGEIMLNEYRAKNQFVDDPEVNAYVRRVAAKLTEQTGRPDLNYQFYVSKNLSPSAQTFPGGIIIVNSGLLQQLRTEAELAGVLSHEVAHAALSHYYQKQAELGLMQAFSRILPLGDLFRDLTDQDYKYRQEYEADILGTRVLAKSGYAADGLWSYLKAFAEAGGSKEAWTSSHPATGDRLARLETLIQTNSYSRYSYDGAAKQQAIAARVDRLLDGQVIANGGSSEGNASIDDETARSAGSKKRKPRSESSEEDDRPVPQKSSQPTTGAIPLNVIQDREGVAFNITQAYVSTARTYTLDTTITNKSDRAFGFVPVFAEVTDRNGKSVVAQYQFPAVGDKGIVVEPGASLTGKIVIPIRKWIPGDRQGIILIITEGSSGGRVFRIGL